MDIKKMLTCNPVLGCSIGCPYCYARRLDTRFRFTPDFSVPTIMPRALKKIHTRVPTSIFMTSMSDLSGWPLDWRSEVFEEIRKWNRNQYLFLTKRPMLVENLDCRDLKNVYIGVTVTNRADTKRIQEMKSNIKAANYWVCFEPLHGDPGILNLRGLSFIIIGPESGNRSGKIVPQTTWIESVVRQADAQGVPVWMKDSTLDIVGESGFRQDPLPVWG